ncbi:MAG: 2Fe-2S iron-sulfur cluster binding domain-containing protein [Lentisphaerae bacterium]|nr:2Fe-2S iron-sulfur cluster binding domain-containing protein [Lentisphaerota bacterium]
MLMAFLIAVGVVCAINTALALLMVAAEAFIADYGACTITVNGERKLAVEGGQSLLSTLKAERIFIPSACGGRGSCGLCKCRVTGGAGNPLPTEEPWLSAEEKAQGVRLSCQVRVKGDLAIVIPAELFNVVQYTTRVTAIRDLTHDIRELRLRLLEPAAIRFAAGQFIQFEVPPYDLTDEPVYRAYSVASPPSVRGEIELEIRYVPEGICTTYVHRHLKVGDAVTINGPYGDFRLRDGEREIIFIAGGSGMAPIKSILYDMREKGIRRKATYFFGAKALRDLFLLDEMRAMEKALPAFRFVPALSAPEAADDWSGERGLITEVVGRRVPDASAMEAYLCGSPLMIDACIEVLKRKGLAEDRIFYDKFA